MVCDNSYATEDVSSKADRPAGCFRLVGPGAGASGNDPSKGADYLSGWSIELSPVGGDVAWGDVDWDDDPFEDLTCGDADPIMVSDRVNICEMFDAEVSLATGKGWKPTVVFDADTDRVVMWKATASAGSGESMFKTVWFDDNLNGAILKDTKAAAQADRAIALALGGSASAANASGLHDLYNQNNADDNIASIWELLTDSNDDLTAGDLGKVDILSDDDDPKTADNETTIVVEECASGEKWGADAADEIATGCGRVGDTAGGAADVVTTRKRATHPDGMADNYPDDLDGADDFRACGEGDGGDDADGSECDAVWVNDETITFADGTFGCSTTRDVTITCTWDADGGMAQGRNALPDAFDGEGDDSNLANFLKCTAE